MGKTKRWWIAGCALAAYSCLLIRVVVFKAIPILYLGHLRLKFSRTRTGPSNLIPFKSIWPLLNGQPNFLIAMVNLFGNIIPFMPVGFLAPFVYRGMRWQTSLILAIATGLTMEIMEFVFRVGIFDVDDILLNASGVMLGYSVFAMLNRRSDLPCGFPES